MEEKLKKIKNLLENSKKIVLINHRRMDGDAYGSLAGFYNLLKKENKYELLCVNEDLKTPDELLFLNDGVEIFSEVNNKSFKNFNPDLIISFDVAGFEQYGEFYKDNKKIFDSVNKICIDHHESNIGIGNINYIDTNSSSTCELTYELIKYLNLEKNIDSNIATLLLAGIITDTNSFYNSNSTSNALKTAGELMGYNPKHQDIIINLFKKKPYNRLKLWGKILENLKDIKNGKVVWNTIPKSLFIQTGTTSKDLSGLIDEFLTTIDGLDVGFLLYELDDGSIKGSFRAKNDKVDLSTFCGNWNGGGHKRASGFLIKGKTLYEVEQEVIQKIGEFYK